MAGRSPLYASPGSLAVVQSSDGVDPSVVPSSSGGTADTSMGTARRPLYIDAVTGQPKAITAPDFISPAVLPASSSGSALAVGYPKFSLGLVTDAIALSVTQLARLAATLIGLDAPSVTTTNTYAFRFPALDTLSLALSQHYALFIDVYLASASDNDSSKTAPANAVGAPDGAVAKVSTGVGGATDTTNPVTLTGAFTAAPSSGSFATKTLTIYGSLAAGTTAVDSYSLTLTYAGGSLTLVNAAASNVPFVSGTSYDVSSLTLAQLQSASLVVSYKSAVVLTPQTAFNLDAARIRYAAGAIA